MTDDLLEAKKPAAGRRMTGGAQQAASAKDPNEALQKALSTHAGKVLAQDIQRKATDLAMEALELRGKLKNAGLDDAAATAAAAQYVLSVAQAAMGAGQGKGR